MLQPLTDLSTILREGLFVIITKTSLQSKNTNNLRQRKKKFISNLSQLSSQWSLGGAIGLMTHSSFSENDKVIIATRGASCTIIVVAETSVRMVEDEGRCGAELLRWDSPECHTE